MAEDGIITESSNQETSDLANDLKKQNKYGMTVLSVTTVGALLATIQGSALMIVLPELMMDLHMEFITLLWVLLVYLMVTTIMVPVLGRLADMFGRKRMYVLGFGVFALGSLLCGLATPMDGTPLLHGGWELVIFRVVQALGGAMLLANSTAMITDAFLKTKLGFGLGVNQIAVAAGIVIGPVIGGILAPFGWEWIFFINVPFGIIGMVWAHIRLREPRWEKVEQRFDAVGAIAFFIGLFGILTACTYISMGDPSQMLIAYVMAVIGIIGIAAFILVERRVRYPMMDLRLFRVKRYTMGNMANLLNGLCMGAATFLLIFYFQGPLGKDALTAGLLLVPSGIPIMIFGPLSGKWSDRYGPRLLMAVGLTMTTIALIGLIFIDRNTPMWYLVIIMVLMGIGGGLFISPNASSVMTAVPTERRGTASGTRIMLRNTGTMFSLAIAFPLVLTGLSQEDMMNIFFGGGSVSSSSLDIFESGLSEAFMIFAAISVISIIVAVMNYERKQRPE